MNNSQKTALGIILGVTAGALAGLLLAPSTGADSRRKITDAAKGYKDDLGTQLSQAIDKLNSYVAKAKTEASSLAKEARTAVENQA